VYPFILLLILSASSYAPEQGQKLSGLSTVSFFPYRYQYSLEASCSKTICILATSSCSRRSTFRRGFGKVMVQTPTFVDFCTRKHLRGMFLRGLRHVDPRSVCSPPACTECTGGKVGSNCKFVNCDVGAQGRRATITTITGSVGGDTSKVLML
jgi:hypothetical protein